VLWDWFFSKVAETKVIDDDNNEWFELLSLQHYFFNLAEMSIQGDSSGWPWSRPNPWGLWPLGMAQMILASGNQFKPFIIIILYRFCFSNFAEKSNLGPPGSVHYHALLLEIYGLWSWLWWSWPLNTNSNHSLLSSSTCFVSATLLKNQTQGPQGVSMTMPYSLKSMASGQGPDGPSIQKPTQTIHFYLCLQLLSHKFT